MSEQSLLSYSSKNFSPTILRLATVYGSSFRQRFDLVVNTFIKNAYFKKIIVDVMVSNLGLTFTLRMLPTQ